MESTIRTQHTTIRRLEGEEELRRTRKEFYAGTLPVIRTLTGEDTPGQGPLSPGRGAEGELMAVAFVRTSGRSDVRDFIDHAPESKGVLSTNWRCIVDPQESTWQLRLDIEVQRGGRNPLSFALRFDVRRDLESLRTAARTGVLYLNAGKPVHGQDTDSLGLRIDGETLQEMVDMFGSGDPVVDLPPGR